MSFMHSVQTCTVRHCHRCKTYRAITSYYLQVCSALISEAYEYIVKAESIV